MSLKCSSSKPKLQSHADSPGFNQIRKKKYVQTEDVKIGTKSEEIAQRLRVHNALEEDPGSIPNTHRGAHNHL